jgi:tetrathionate reductase subunit B
MGKVLVIDITRCNGCHNCQVACKDEHCGNDWLPVARAQPQSGQFWNRVVDKVRGTVPKVKVAYEHTICQHCDDAPCIKACPEQAIYKRPDGIVIIDPLKCRGHKACIAACPYEYVIWFNEDLNISQKCTFCAHLIDRGWTETRCSEVCPTGAFTFGEEEDLKDLILRSEPLKPALTVKPRVYYIGLPKRFIGATLVDAQAGEVVSRAGVHLSQMPNGSAIGVWTDEFGDFWVDNLPAAKYQVTIHKEGYKNKILKVDATRKDINLGDVVLEREG